MRVVLQVADLATVLALETTVFFQQPYMSLAPDKLYPSNVQRHK